MGGDAVQAVARAADEYGSPDGAEVHENASVWGWMRGDVQLIIFHNHRDQALSNVILDRYRR
jgi:tetrahydromethanopterin S-methyltransferase subunit H